MLYPIILIMMSQFMVIQGLKMDTFISSYRPYKDYSTSPYLKLSRIPYHDMEDRIVLMTDSFENVVSIPIVSMGGCDYGCDIRVLYLNELDTSSSIQRSALYLNELDKFDMHNQVITWNTFNHKVYQYDSISTIRVTTNDQQLTLNLMNASCSSTNSNGFVLLSNRYIVLMMETPHGIIIFKSLRWS